MRGTLFLGKLRLELSIGSFYLFQSYIFWKRRLTIPCCIDNKSLGHFSGYVSVS